MSNPAGSRLATVLRWPFMRWRNMAAAGAILLALIVVQGRINSALHDDGTSTSAAAVPASPSLTPDPTITRGTRSATTTPSSSTSSSASTAAQSPEASPTVSATSSPAGASPAVPAAVAQGPAEQVAQSFITAWTATGDSARWHQQVAALATPTYAADLNTTDPERVPVTEVGAMTSSVSTNDGLQTVTFDTDAGPIAVEVTNTGTAWLVSQVNPVDQPPGAPALDLGDLGEGS